jgi:DNA-binding NarL/FixJ family response regulator
LPQTARHDPVRVVIADDHPIFRDGLRKLLESDPGFKVVAEAADGNAALALARTEHPDIVLLDVAMPRMGGLEVLEAIKATAARVVILTAAISDANVLRAIQLGASGIVLKEAASRQLLTDVRRVVDGDFVIGPEVLSELTRATRAEAPVSARPFNLTARERELVAAVVAGRSNRDIAEQMGISVQTVKHHLTSIFDKTGVSSRLELALFALRQGLATDDE